MGSKIKCRKCGRMIVSTETGRARPHNDPDSGKLCEGTGQFPRGK